MNGLTCGLIGRVPWCVSTNSPVTLSPCHLVSLSSAVTLSPSVRRTGAGNFRADDGGGPIVEWGAAGGDGTTADVREGMAGEEEGTLNPFRLLARPGARGGRNSCASSPACAA